MDQMDEKTGAVIEVGKAQEDIAEFREKIKQEREEGIAYINRLVGRMETANMVGKLMSVSTLMWLREIKSEKLYRSLETGGTWDTFCEYIGQSRRHVDEQLQNLSAFGSSFLKMAQSMSIGYRELRKLRTSITDGNMVIDDGMVVFEDERIPLTPDYRDDLQGALEQIVESKIKLRNELEKERTEREKLIKAQTRGLETERDALVKEVQTLKKKIPEDKDYSEWAVDQIKMLEDQVTKFAWACQGMIADPQLEKDHVSQGKIYGMFDAMEAELADIRKRFDEALPRLY